jgi:hypothetical protein
MALLGRKEGLKSMPTPHELEFHAKMIAIYHRAEEETGYVAKYFLQMVAADGGVQTAKTLINANAPADGYTELWRLGRLDLTVEALVVENPEWHDLFTAEEIERARTRLKDYEYEIN